MTVRRGSPERDRRELEVLHRVAVALSQSLSTSDVLFALTRELVLGVPRACECAISLWDEQRDVLIDAAAYTENGPPAWPRGQVENPLADYPATRRLLRRGRGWGEYRMSDPALTSNDREVLEVWGWRAMIELPLPLPSCTDTSSTSWSRGRPLVEAEKTAESLSPEHSAVVVRGGRAFDQPVRDAVVYPNSVDAGSCGCLPRDGFGFEEPPSRPARARSCRFTQPRSNDAGLFFPTAICATRRGRRQAFGIRD